jgi:putative nucleotidyltransferase-like protein
MRYSRDVDVLVAREDLGRAIDALEPLGWRSEPGQATEPVLHVNVLHEAGLPDIELHWRVHWYEADFGARALARAQPGPDGVQRLRAEDDLAALMLYQARDGFAGLRHPTDIATWWDTHAIPDAPPVLEPIVREHPVLARALTAAAALNERLVGVPAAGLLQVPPHLPWGAARAIALANPLMRGRPQQITAEVSVVDGLLSPKRQRIAYFRRRALPSAHDLPATDRPLAIARAEHTLRVVRRYLLAVVRSRPGAG